MGGENGDRERKREGGENGDGERKGGDRMQQQTAGRAANVEDKGVKADEPATSRTSARLNEPATQRKSAEPDSRADLLKVLLRVDSDAEVKTTMPPSPRRPISLGSAQSATGSRRRTA